MILRERPNHIGPRLKRRVLETIRRCNDKGMIVGIIWLTDYAGINQSNNGWVIRQYQYGSQALQFNISHDQRTVRFLQKNRVILPHKWWEQPS